MDHHAALACTVYIVGGIVLGALPLDAWRPRDDRLRAIVDACAVDSAEHGSISAARVADRLRALDPEWPWCSHITYAITRFDFVRGELARLMPVANAVDRTRRAHDRFVRQSRRAGRQALVAVDARDRLDEAAADLQRVLAEAML